MSILTTTKILVNCKDCEKEYDLIDGDIECYCDDCHEQSNSDIQKHILLEILDEIEKYKKLEIDGVNICGFETEQQKKDFLQGYKRGAEDSMHTIAMVLEDHFGINVWDKFYEIHKHWKDQEVKAELDRYDTHRCKTCDGNGYMKNTHDS